jgi:hypothetical protein
MTINGLKAKLVEKKGKIAQIEIEGQKIEVAAEFLPPNVGIGGELRLYFSSADEGTISEKKLAKSILEEILNGR